MFYTEYLDLKIVLLVKKDRKLTRLNVIVLYSYCNFLERKYPQIHVESIFRRSIV